MAWSSSLLVALLLAVLVLSAHATHASDSALLKKLAAYEALQSDPFAARRTLRGHGDNAPDSLRFSLRAFGDEHSFDLSLYRGLFGDDYKHVHIDEHGNQIVASREKDCIYRGANRTVFAFCGGVVHGRFHRDGEEVHLRPLASGSHIVFRRRDLQEEHTGKCGVDDASIAATKKVMLDGAVVDFDAGPHVLPDDAAYDVQHGEHKSHDLGAGVASGGHAIHGRRLASNELELIVFNDHARYERFGPGVEADTAYIVSLLADLYSELPGPNEVVIKLVAMYSMVRGDPWPVTAANGGFSVGIEELLDDFSAYMGTIKGVLPPFDHVHLMSELDFFNISSLNDAVIGLSFVGMLCQDMPGATGRVYRSGVTQASFDDHSYISGVFAHQLGHNLGMQHTSVSSPLEAPSSPCDTLASEVMDATAGEDVAWSSCTHEYWNSKLNGLGSFMAATCVAAPAYTAWAPPVCGNGIREGEEECDCFLNNCTGIDSCCNATSCTLLAGTCSEQDPCCDPGTCTPTPNTSQVCRVSADAACDPAPETCDGVHAACPLDVVAAAGTLCDGSDGKCWLGKCVSLDDQCVANGFPNGGCGNQPCNSKLRCKYIPNMPGPEACTAFFLATASFPDDGSPCSGGQCYGGSCVASGALPTPADLANCSNGVQDNLEVDVDCGGSCLPCFGGKKCVVDSDCLYPGFCNETLLKCQVLSGSGILTTPAPTDAPTRAPTSSPESNTTDAPSSAARATLNQLALLYFVTRVYTM